MPSPSKLFHNFNSSYNLFKLWDLSGQDKFQSIGVGVFNGRKGAGNMKYNRVVNL